MKRVGALFVKGISVISNLGGYISGWLVLALVLLTFVEAFMRYALSRPPGVADEFGGYLNVAMIMLGAAYAFKEKAHVRITAVVSRLPKHIANWLRLGGLIVAFALVVALNYASYLYLAVSFKYGLKSETWLLTPLQGPQMTINIGLAFLALWLMVEVGKAITNVKSDRSLRRGEG